MNQITISQLIKFEADPKIKKEEQNLNQIELFESESISIEFKREPFIEIKDNLEDNETIDKVIEDIVKNKLKRKLKKKMKLQIIEQLQSPITSMIENERNLLFMFRKKLRINKLW